MDQISSAAAVSAALQKDHAAEGVALAARSDAPTATPEALDPRPVYTLSPEAAAAVLSLALGRTQAGDNADFDARYGRASQLAGIAMASAVATTPIVSPETSKSAAAASRTWNADVRLDHDPLRTVGSDTRALYDTPRVIAAWSTAFPDLATRRTRTFAISVDKVRDALSKIAADGGFDESVEEIYLICDGERYKIFSEDHPNTRINWISVDNGEILLYWPKNKQD
jgi:hypothetical protein